MMFSEAEMIVAFLAGNATMAALLVAIQMFTIE